MTADELDRRLLACAITEARLREQIHGFDNRLADDVIVLTAEDVDWRGVALELAAMHATSRNPADIALELAAVRRIALDLLAGGGT